MGDFWPLWGGTRRFGRAVGGRDEETYSRYATGIQVKQYLSRRQDKPAGREGFGMAILIPKILRYSFIQAQGRQAHRREAQGRVGSTKGGSGFAKEP